MLMEFIYSFFFGNCWRESFRSSISFFLIKGRDHFNSVIGRDCLKMSEDELTEVELLQNTVSEVSLLDAPFVDASTLFRVAALSAAAAGKAGDIIKKIMTRCYRNVHDPQTEARRLAQKCIMESLLSKFPQLTIIGEEDISTTAPIPHWWLVNEESRFIATLNCPTRFQEVTDKDIVAWVKPLDGVAELTEESKINITVLIGLAVGDEPVCGVVHQPYYCINNRSTEGRTVWAIKDGCFGGLQVKPALKDKLIVTVPESYSDKLLEDALVKLNADEILKIAGTGSKVLKILDGLAHACIIPSEGLKRWDTCALEVLLECIGGKVTDINGNKYIYSKDTDVNNVNGLVAAIDEKYHSKCQSVFQNDCQKS